MPIAPDIFDRLRAAWIEAGVTGPQDLSFFPKGASEEAIAAAERRLGIRMPFELREFYRTFGELRDFTLHGTGLFWFGLENCFKLTDPLSINPTAVGSEIPLSDLDQYVVVADHMIGIDHFAIRCGPPTCEPVVGEVVQLTNWEVLPGTSTFDDFLRYLLDNPNECAFFRFR